MATFSIEREALAPDWAVHPGEVLAERLEAYGITPAELARRTGLTPKNISEIINGEGVISAETAVALGPVLGLAPAIWSNLQTEWRLAKAKREARPSQAKAAEFIAQFPISELVSRGALPRSKDCMTTLEALLKLFGIANIERYQSRLAGMDVRYRHTDKYESSPHHLFAWMQLGELEAWQMDHLDYNKSLFDELVRTELRKLTVFEPQRFVPEMKALCREAGVAVLIVKPFSGTKLTGSARWMDTGNPIIQLSLRNKSNDHFWFTFFHECGHVLLHEDQNFVDDEKASNNEAAEKQADHFAEEVLVGRSRFAEFCYQSPSTERQVKEFAQSVGIHPGIVVGMLQHRREIPWATKLNSLKARYEFAN